MVPLADFEVQQFCTCHAPAFRMISAPRFMVENVDYRCPITEKHIGSKRDHENNLSEHNCRVLEPGEAQASRKYREDSDRALDKQLDNAVDREWEVMPSAKKEKLATELLAGTDLAVERRIV
jgi:hypothetical protein